MDFQKAKKIASSVGYELVYEYGFNLYDPSQPEGHKIVGSFHTIDSAIEYIFDNCEITRKKREVRILDWDDVVQTISGHYYRMSGGKLAGVYNEMFGKDIWYSEEDGCFKEEV